MWTDFIIVDVFVCWNEQELFSINTLITQFVTQKVCIHMPLNKSNVYMPLNKSYYLLNYNFKPTSVKKFMHDNAWTKVSLIQVKLKLSEAEFTWHVSK